MNLKALALTTLTALTLGAGQAMAGGLNCAPRDFTEIREDLYQMGVIVVTAPEFGFGKNTIYARNMSDVRRGAGVYGVRVNACR